jgi:hypothetical protein
MDEGLTGRNWATDGFHDPTADLLFTAAEAGPMLNVKPATITKWKERGYLKPAARWGPSYAYRWCDLVEAEHQRRALAKPRGVSED